MESLLDEKQQKTNHPVVDLAALGMTRYAIPLQDFSAPTVPQMNEFLKILKTELLNGRVFVHCQGGSGRTGTMGAAYWIQAGMSAEKAINRIRESNPIAIETTDQEACLTALELSMKTKPKTSSQ